MPNHGAGLAGATVLTDPPAIWVRRGAPTPMPFAHRHDDLELNLVLGGRLDYLFGGHDVRVGAGELAVFWAGTPHHLVKTDEPVDGQPDVCWVQLPLSEVLSWSMPNADLATLMCPSPVVLALRSVARDASTLFDFWSHELMEPGTEEHAVALLEAQALTRRALLQHRLQHPRPDTASTGSGGDRKEPRAAEMARYIATHFREPIGPRDVAAAVHLNPTYAMTTFRAATGSTIGEWLTQCRVAEAQRLLLTSSATISDVAHAAGFASQSSFYTHFTAICGQPPAGYRRARGLAGRP